MQRKKRCLEIIVELEWLKGLLKPVSVGLLKTQLTIQLKLVIESCRFV